MTAAVRARKVVVYQLKVGSAVSTGLVGAHSQSVGRSPSSRRSPSLQAPDTGSLALISV